MFKFFLLLMAIICCVEGCNEVLCASVASKCSLLRNCECDIDVDDLDNCECCQSCRRCLGFMLAECGVCFNLVRPANISDDVHVQSATFDIPNGDPTYFADLASAMDGDALDALTFPVDVVMAGGANATVNCTVAYLQQCVDEQKCRDTCTSLAAGAGRWFSSGCCECVSSECDAGSGSLARFGLESARCGECEEDEDELNYDELTDEELDDLVTTEQQGIDS